MNYFNQLEKNCGTTNCLTRIEKKQLCGITSYFTQLVRRNSMEEQNIQAELRKL